jgi:hypothetical protein
MIYVLLLASIIGWHSRSSASVACPFPHSGVPWRGVFLAGVHVAWLPVVCCAISWEFVFSLHVIRQYYCNNVLCHDIGCICNAIILVVYVATWSWAHIRWASGFDLKTSCDIFSLMPRPTEMKEKEGMVDEHRQGLLLPYGGKNWTSAKQSSKGAILAGRCNGVAHPMFRVARTRTRGSNAQDKERRPRNRKYPYILKEHYHFMPSLTHTWLIVKRMHFDEIYAYALWSSIGTMV